MSQITTITFFKFKGFSNKMWALSMMQLAHGKLSKIEGQIFYKLMGSGKGVGFNPLPDWSTYALLQVWQDERSADHYFQSADVYREYQDRSEEIWNIYMKNVGAHGEWDRMNPFEQSTILPSNPTTLVLTRATIKWSRMIDFWRFVPKSHESLSTNEGLIYTKGVGELPIVQMATISLWKDEESVKRFAYESAAHKEAIRRTRELKWYKEELFARFKPYESLGSWEGVNPLAGLL
ncbi:MAG: spheroidene monooxygenase [Ekhidna sp.]